MRHPAHRPASSQRFSGFILGTEGYGVRRAWLGIFEGLRRRGLPMRAIVMQRGEIGTTLEEAGVAVAYLDASANGPLAEGAGKLRALAARVLRQAVLLRRLVRAIREAGSDVLLFRSPLEVPLAGLAATLCGIRAYWLMPNAVSSTYPFDLNLRIYRFIFRFLNVVPIANSRYTDTTIGPGTFERHWCHLGVDPEEFAPERPGALSRAEIGLPEDAIVLGVLARMVEEKGQRRLVEALADLGEAAASVHLLLCGGPMESDYARSLQALVAETGLTARVHFRGPVRDVASCYKLCDVVVNSRLDPEPFGLSVIEGMMLGKPVLAHKAGGPGETVLDGVTGWHIHGPDRAAFVEALRRMLADRPRLAEIGRAARAHALAHFTSDRMVERLVGIIGGAADPRLPADEHGSVPASLKREAV